MSKMNGKKALIIILVVLFAILIAGAVIAAVIIFGGGADGGEDETTLEEENFTDAEMFYEDIEVESVDLRCENGLYYVDAEVKIINYIPYMEECFDKAEKNSSDDDFQSVFYEYVLEASDGAKKEKLEITFCLYSIDPEKTDWEEDELEGIVKQKAFDKQASEFAMDRLYELMPEISESDGEVAE